MLPLVCDSFYLLCIIPTVLAICCKLAFCCIPGIGTVRHIGMLYIGTVRFIDVALCMLSCNGGTIL